MVIGFCPECCEDKKLDIEVKDEVISVRGDDIISMASYHVCTVCGCEFFTKEDIDPRVHAYNVYRTKHGMVSPDKLKEFRASHNLEKNEFADFLGIDREEYSRYENGALHSEDIDKLFRFVTNRRQMVDLVWKMIQVIKI